MLIPLLLLTSPQEDMQSVLNKLKANLQAAKSISMTVKASSEGDAGVQTWTVKALRPNYFRAESDVQLFLSDGQMTWQLLKKDNRYGRMYPADQKGLVAPFTNGFQLYSPSSQYKGKYDAFEKGTFNGRDAFVLIERPSEVPGLELKVYIDAKTYLPIGSDQKVAGKVSTNIYEDLRLDAALKPSDFMWTRPEGAVDMAAERVAFPYPKAGEQRRTLKWSSFQARRPA